MSESIWIVDEVGCTTSLRVAVIDGTELGAELEPVEKLVFVAKAFVEVSDVGDDDRDAVGVVIVGVIVVAVVIEVLEAKSVALVAAVVEVAVDVLELICNMHPVLTASPIA